MSFELTEGMVQDYATTESFTRGEDYYHQDAVLSLTRRGGLLRQGSLEAALRVGEHGLSLEGRNGSLAIWARDLAD